MNPLAARSQKMSMPVSDKTSDLMGESDAHSLDAADPMARFRERFFMPPGTIYLDGVCRFYRGFRGKAIYSGRINHLLRRV